MQGNIGGQDFLVQVEFPKGSANFTTLGGVKQNNLNIESTHEVQTSKGFQRWQELAQFSGETKISLGSEMVFSKGLDEHLKNYLLTAYIKKELLCLRIVSLQVQFIGNFLIGTLDTSGATGATQDLSLSFESSGEIDISF